MSSDHVANGAVHVTLDLNHEPSGEHVGQREATVTPAAAPVDSEKVFWTPQKVIYSLILFVVSGLAEIGGGWLIFQAIRVERPFWWAIIGSVILIIYGFIPTLQPISNFGRVFAVYGG